MFTYGDAFFFEMLCGCKKRCDDATQNTQAGGRESTWIDAPEGSRGHTILTLCFLYAIYLSNEAFSLVCELELSFNLSSKTKKRQLNF